MKKYDLLIFHTMVGSLWGTDGYFRGDGYGGSESHWGVGYDGECLQWQDTAFQAEANGAANTRALSVETADIGTGFPKWNTNDGGAVPAWTPSQVNRLVDITVWSCRTHGIPCRLITSSKPDQRGIGWHRLGVPGFVVAGGELWSSARGKACPGNRRIAQVPDIVSRAAKILGGAPPASPGPAPRPVPSTARPTLREGDTGDAVAKVQAWLKPRFSYARNLDLAPRRYGPATVAIIKEFQRRTGVTGPDADGTIIGPRTWAQLEKLGYR